MPVGSAIVDAHAGSTHVEDDVFLAGQAGLADHVTIGKGARVTVQGGVIGDIDPGATVSGYPARSHREFLRAQGDTVEVISLPDRGYLRSLATRHLPEVKCDVVVEDELCHPALAFRKRRQAEPPVVALVHLLRSDEHRRSALRPLYSAVERRYLTGVDATVFNSATTRACRYGRFTP